MDRDVTRSTVVCLSRTCPLAGEGLAPVACHHCEASPVENPDDRPLSPAARFLAAIGVFLAPAGMGLAVAFFAPTESVYFPLYPLGGLLLGMVFAIFVAGWLGWRSEPPC